MPAIRYTSDYECELESACLPPVFSGNAPRQSKGKMGSTEEPDRKKRLSVPNHTLSPSPAKKQNSSSSMEDKKIEPGMLQYQNQKLSQQLEVQRLEIHDLEEKISLLRNRQANFDETLIVVNRAWNQLVEDLEVFSTRINGGVNGRTSGDKGFLSIGNGDHKASHPEHTFLERLMQASARDSSGDEMWEESLDASLMKRRAETTKMLASIVDALQIQRQRSEEVSSLLRSKLTENEALKLWYERERELKAELDARKISTDDLQVKLKELRSRNAELQDKQALDACEIKRLKDQLDEAISEVEASRRKVVALRQNDNGATPTQASLAVKKEPGISGEVGYGSDRVYYSSDDAQRLAGKRLQELEEANRINLSLRQKMRMLEVEIQDEQRLRSSQPFHLLNDQILFLRSEVDRYRLALEQVQRERDLAVLREKEMTFKAEAGDASRRACQAAEKRAQELEEKLQQCMLERDGMEVELENKHRMAGREETVAELKVMVSTLHKEMNMMHSSLSKYKEASQEVHALRAEAQALASILERKTKECEDLQQRLMGQAEELNSVKDEMSAARDTEFELKMFLQMFERESTDSRDVLEVKQAERRAMATVERLKLALDEHSLALRVKAANEAEAACQQRLGVAEAEIVQLRQKLDTRERLVIELKDSLQAKNEEGEAYISEIETIGQAYEDMQAQNRRLLQQITERDDYNTQLMSESVKAKQVHTSLLAEKEAMAGRMQHVSSICEVHKQRVVRLEEQMKVCLEQIGKDAEEIRLQQATVEQAKHRQKEAEAEAELAKAALESAQAELEERARKLGEADAEVEKERFKRRRLEEAEGMHNMKAAKMGQHDRGPAMDKLQEELKEYKSMLRCSVCDDRPKEVVITKCFHLFCSPCIQRNLEIRHRKCPGCGVPFGQNDVRNVYM